MDKSLAVFEKYVKSGATRKHYQYWFKDFMAWCKIDVDKLITADGLLILKDSALQTMVEDYVMFKRKRLSPNSLQVPIGSLSLFFSMNDKVLNWERIKKMIPEQAKKAGYSAYQDEDIRNMLDATTSKRNRAMIHVLASTGMRAGALCDINLKHVSNMPEDCKSILVYADTTSEYYTFLTSEASKVVDEMLDSRRNDGEHINDESPLFRANYQVGIQKVESITPAGVWSVLSILAGKAKGRKRISTQRFNVSTSHGFRKRYATLIKLDNKISWAVSERLLGHKSYLDENYFRPTKENLFNEWLKVMPVLIVSQEERLKVENIKKDEKIQSLSDEKDKRIAELEASQRNVAEQVRGLYELLSGKD